MKTEEYEVEVQRTAAGTGDLALAGMGLAGEVGEVVDMLKKHLFHDKPYDREALVKELGDVLWYFTLLRLQTGVSLDEVMEKNVAKLRARYPNGYTHADAKSRRDLDPQRVPEVALIAVDELGSTERGAGGFGSTGTGEVAPTWSRLVLGAGGKVLREEVLSEGSGPLARAPVTTETGRVSFGAGRSNTPREPGPIDNRDAGVFCTACGGRWGCCCRSSQPDLFRGDGDEGAPLGDPDE